MDGDRLASYAGLAPVTRQSGKSINGESKSRRGNHRLKNAMFLAAFASLRSPDPKRSRDRSARKYPMPPEPPPLGEDDVTDRGGWQPRYVRVLAIANEGDVSFALVGGNGDGHIDDLGPYKTGHIGDAPLDCSNAP